MSIEKQVEALIEAVERNTAALEQVAANQEKALGQLPSGEDSSKSGRSRRSRSKADDDEDDDEKPTRSRRSRSKADDDEDDEKPTRSRRSRSKADDDEDDEKPTRSRSKAKPATKGKKKKTTIDDVKAKFAELFEVDTEDEEEEARSFLDSVLDELAVDKTTDIDAEDFDRVIGWVEKKLNGEKVSFDD